MKPRYTFRRFLYLLAAGYFIGGGIAELSHDRPEWAIIAWAIAAIMIIYRLYHPDMLLKKVKR